MLLGNVLFQIYSRTFGRLDLNLRDYSVVAVLLCISVVLLELRWWRTGLFRMRAYRVTMVICFGFMIIVNGWLTKLSAPIVRYASDEFSGWRPIWDIPFEDYLFGFAMLTFSLLCWVRTENRRTPLTRTEPRPSRPVPGPARSDGAERP